MISCPLLTPFVLFLSLFGVCFVVMTLVHFSFFSKPLRFSMTSRLLSKRPGPRRGSNILKLANQGTLGPLKLHSGTVTSYFHHFWHFLFLFSVFFHDRQGFHRLVMYTDEASRQKVYNSAPSSLNFFAMI